MLEGASGLSMLSLRVAKLAKSFGWLGLAESLGDFRYDITRKLNVDGLIANFRFLGCKLFRLK